MMLEPDQETELHDYFSGVLAAAMGMQSAVSGILKTLVRGCHIDNVGYELDDRVLEAAWREAYIREALEGLTDTDRLVLRLYYEPMSEGERNGLDIFGKTARVAVVLYGLANKDVQKTPMTLTDYSIARVKLAAQCARARNGSKDEKLQASTILYGLVFQASNRVKKAQDAYSKQVEKRGTLRRPWYVPSTGERMRMRREA